MNKTKVIALAACAALGGQPSLSGAQTPRGQAFEVYEASITDLQNAMTAGRTTSVALVDAYLARIAAYDHKGPALNALIRLNPNARAEAQRLDDERRRGRVRGPLHGIPIIIKDNFDTSDLPTSGGSLALANHQTRDDAFVVRKLRDVGAIILAKSNLHELAAGITTISSLGGQTLNPYDPRRCPGGSSGGTGAAIAASFGAVGWGSDTCGSIRIPSAFGSLAGLRPTQGLVSRSGVMPLSHTQDIPRSARTNRSRSRHRARRDRRCRFVRHGDAGADREAHSAVHRLIAGRRAAGRADRNPHELLHRRRR
jgi:Asp-tRNA(Asn)/Glu-tRNA(Gln) amidotransferase A subunit family amidase